MIPFPEFKPLGDLKPAAPASTLLGIHTAFPENRYNGNDLEILKYWRSSQIPKKAKNYIDFHNQLVVPKAEISENDKSFFKIGRFVEDWISGIKGKWVVFDESERPCPDADFRNSANRAFREAFYIENSDVEVINFQDIEFLSKLHANAAYKKTIDKMRYSDQQVTIFWSETTIIDGIKVEIPLRVRLDYSKGGVASWIVDHKTTRDERGKFCRFTIDDNGLKTQAMMQRRAAMVSGYAENPTFSWAVHSKVWPFEFFLVDFETIEEYTASKWPILMENIGRFLLYGANEKINIESI